MSIKTDRPQVRTPEQLEQKYNLANIEKTSKELEISYKQLNDSLNNYKEDMKLEITTDSITSDTGNFDVCFIDNQKVLIPYELFYDANGSNADITLSETSANYDYLEIFYFYNTNDSYMSEKIYNPDGKSFQLNGNYDNGTRYYMATSVYSISGATITRDEEIRWRIGTGGENNTRTDTTSNDNNIYIERIIGYK